MVIIENQNPMNPIRDRIMDSTETAKYIERSPRTLAKWRCTKEENLPYFKVGKKACYSKNAVDAWYKEKIERTNKKKGQQ